MRFLNIQCLIAWATLALMPGVYARATGKSDSECQHLNRAYDSVLFLPGETGYSELRLENWSDTSDRNPACIFKPDSAHHLSKVVRQLQRNRVKFAIRSGGHLPSPDAANIDNGVLIDLGGFDKVEFKSVENTVTIGSGARWGEVYKQLDQHDMTVVGGRVLDVGVGGLILGSGLSYLSDIYGLACDNVVNFEVVLGDGSVVNANKSSNSDLFWALKGGGNNFGIVTRFTVSAYPNPQIWGGVKSYTFADLPALFSAMYEYETAPTKDPKANLMMQGYVSDESIGVVLNMIYLAPEVSPAAFAPFYRINTTSDTTKLSSLSEFLAGQGPINFPPRVDWRTASFIPDKDLYSRLTALLTETPALERIKKVPSGTVAFGMQPISQSVVEAGTARGGNAMGLQNTNQNWFKIDSGWQHAADDQTVHFAVKEIVDSIEAEAKAVKKSIPVLFMNDGSYDQDIISSYGPASVARLKSVSAKYDPFGTFQKLVPGGFKLPKS